MTLHIFNPEHEIALAANLVNYTAPFAGRQLRTDLGYLPAIWANDGDVVLVENIEQAKSSFKQLQIQLKPLLSQIPNVVFARNSCDFHPAQIDSIAPWGWDKTLCATLRRMSIDDGLMPSEAQLANIRLLSHRRKATEMLKVLQTKGTTGYSIECFSFKEIVDLQSSWKNIVLKAPWSSSGRGLRYVLSADALNSPHLRGWICHLLEQQGSIMAEPIYNKVIDFGMEFTADNLGRIHYEGLSIFQTTKGAYKGNLIASESKKMEILRPYVSYELLDYIKEKISQHLILNDYTGPFGIDMMICKDTSFLLHPCVEINLRHTMGHVALSLTHNNTNVVKLMRIDYDGKNYKLNIS